MELPRLKDKVNTEKISLAIDLETKKRLESLKWDKRVNVSEWLRQIIKKNLELCDKESA
jgi:hypothetical protein